MEQTSIVPKRRIGPTEIMMIIGLIVLSAAFVFSILRDDTEVYHEARAKARDQIEKQITQRLSDVQEKEPGALQDLRIPEGEQNAQPVCKPGDTSDNCINMDKVIGGLLEELQDSEESGAGSSKEQKEEQEQEQISFVIYRNPEGKAQMKKKPLFPEGSQGNPYKITSCRELQKMEEHMDAWFELQQDIDCKETATWNNSRGFDSIGYFGNPFTGSLNGKGFAIRNLSINDPEREFAGLFGLMQDASIEHVHFAHAYVSGLNSVGIAVGLSQDSTIDRVSVDGDVFGSNCGVSAWGGCGGLVGLNQRGTVQNSFSTANVQGKGSGLIGGIAGYNVEGTVKHSYAIGNVAGPVLVGGLVGHNDLGQITDAFYDASAITCKGCTNTFGSVTGVELTSREFLEEHGWNFRSVWKEVFGAYPALR